MNVPSFKFDVRLLGGDVTSMPFLEEWLQNVLCSFLENYTLPNNVRRSPRTESMSSAKTCCQHITAKRKLSSFSLSSHSFKGIPRQRQ